MRFFQDVIYVALSRAYKTKSKRNHLPKEEPAAAAGSRALEADVMRHLLPSPRTSPLVLASVEVSHLSAAGVRAQLRLRGIDHAGSCAAIMLRLECALLKERDRNNLATNASSSPALQCHKMHLMRHYYARIRGSYSY